MSKKCLKFFGAVLLILGVGVIIWTLFLSYNIFTGETDAPALFDLEKEEENLPPGTEEIIIEEGDFPGEIEELLEDQFSTMLPAGAMGKMFNLIAWSVLAFILIFGGSHLATLGIKILKEGKRE